ILASLLDISRLESGTQQVAMRDVALEPLLEALAREFGILAEARGLSLRHAPTRLAVHSDEALLRRILQNLLSNAVRYTARGRIVLGCRRAGDAVRIEVWDSGPGIPEARQREIFEEFRRLDDSSDDSGAGLGLAIVDRIARLLGHGIALRSRPGHGSVFSVTLPRALTDPATASIVQATAPAAPEPTPLHGHVVWCIDDDAQICAAAPALLQRWGCEVAFAGGAEAARAQARAGCAPELVLLDLHMGDDRGDRVFDALGACWGASPP